jgi:hypothetical protein
MAYIGLWVGVVPGGTMRWTITALITLTVLPALVVVATLPPRLMRSATKPPPYCDNDTHDAITKDAQCADGGRLCLRILEDWRSWSC